MDIKKRIREKLDEMIDADNLSHNEKKTLDNIKPEFKLSYHLQDIPLKSKTLKGAKDEAIKYAADHGFKPHHATLIKFWKVNGVGGRTSDVEEKHRLPFTP